MSIVDLPRTPSSHAPSAGDDTVHPLHPAGSKAKVLLSSVFGPYAVDDEHGSRAINPMELWHNQVTRVQGPFSLRMFHRSWGLMLIQANIEARCTCLDFPTRERFIAEIRDNAYDVIGLSGIVPNFTKIKTMCELIREHAPDATIVVGGHIAGLPELSERIDADHIVYSEGVGWFRRFLGEDASRPIRHPQIRSGVGRRVMGADLPYRDDRTSAATLIPSVGCPMGCNFCATSAMFGGKGKSFEFFESAEQLYAVMTQLEREMNVKSFFVMDENFLLKRDRAMKLLEFMRRDGKPWSLYVFSSANALAQYTMDDLVALGVTWVWLGLEGKDSQYGKLAAADTRTLVAELQSNGIRVLGSTIIGLEEHTDATIDEAIDYAVAHDADFHQFMLYTAVAGTPLYAEHDAGGTLLAPHSMDFEDTHGQYRFNYRHPNIAGGGETAHLLRAFEQDYRVNGPSILRVVSTTLKGYHKHRRHADPRIRARFAMEIEGFRHFYPAAVWAAKRWFADNPGVVARLDALGKDLARTFGWLPRLAAPTLGRLLLRSIRREARRLESGWTWEPPTFYERNYVDAAADNDATVLKTVPGLETQTAAT